MPYTLGERIYGIRDVGEQSITAHNSSFLPLAAGEIEEKLVDAGKGTMLLLGIGVVALIWWALTVGKKEEPKRVPVPGPDFG